MCVFCALALLLLMAVLLVVDHQAEHFKEVPPAVLVPKEVTCENLILFFLERYESEERKRESQGGRGGERDTLTHTHAHTSCSVSRFPSLPVHVHELQLWISSGVAVQ